MLLYLCAVAVLCFANMGKAPAQGTIWGIPSDKIVHFLLFIPFPFLAWAWPCSRPRTETVPYIIEKICLIFLLGLLLGFATEYTQGYLPHRTRERLDYLADFCGITAACLSIVIFKLCRQEA